MAIVVVSGLQRSGTSLMMRIVQAAGIPLWYQQDSAVARPAAMMAFNPAGFFEDRTAAHGDFSAVPDGYAVKCMTALPTADPATPARVIIMRRDIQSVLASQQGFAAGTTTGVQIGDHMADVLLGYMDDIRCWCAAKPHIEVWYEDLQRDTASEMQRIARFLGMPWDNRLADMAHLVDGRSF